MEEENFMPKAEETPESKELNRIINEFNNILRKTDLYYNEKIFFNITYNLSADYYKINIFPARNGFNSQKYFMNNFEINAGQEKLAKFANKNNIGIISY